MQLVAQALRSYRWMFLLRGLLAILFGILALTWPGITLLALVYLSAGHRPALPTGQASAVVLFEHQWAIPFKEAVLKAHGQVLAEGLLTPETLVALGARLQAARTAAELADDTQR